VSSVRKEHFVTVTSDLSKEIVQITFCFSFFYSNNSAMYKFSVSWFFLANILSSLAACTTLRSMSGVPVTESPNCNCRLAGHEILYFLRNPKVHYGVYNIQQSNSILS
jgi:hypothetical protein